MSFELLFSLLFVGGLGGLYYGVRYWEKKHAVSLDSTDTAIGDASAETNRSAVSARASVSLSPKVISESPKVVDASAETNRSAVPARASVSLSPKVISESPKVVSESGTYAVAAGRDRKARAERTAQQSLLFACTQPVGREAPLRSRAPQRGGKEALARVPGGDTLDGTLVFHLINQQRLIRGSDLLTVMREKVGMQYDTTAECFVFRNGGQEWFRLCNAVEPGLFSLDDLEAITTPGLVIGMRVPAVPVGDTVRAFERMCSTIQLLTADFGLSVRDRYRKLLAPAALSHQRSSLKQQYGHDR